MSIADRPIYQLESRGFNASHSVEARVVKPAAV